MSRRIVWLAACAFVAFTGCRKEAASPQTFSYGVPLDSKSPWPKFRRDPAQDARSPLAPKYNGGQPWSFATGKGIFSSPIIDGNGTVFIGSADRYFYAIDKTGQLKWKKLTGEIVDSAGLLDDQGHVYFGSGDGHVYALNAATGEELWRFQADDAKTVNSTFAYINWFEGNVGMSASGHLIAPNDNNLVYALDRNTGAKQWSYLSRDQNWSLPALNVATGQLFLGNNSVVGAIAGDGANVFALSDNGDELWTKFTLGTVAASAVLTDDGALIIGSFDGYVRSYDQHTGAIRWEFPTRDHIYSSPALLPDGTVIQPSTDGTVYAIDAKTGQQRWAFDALEPIRSSPAVDGEGNIYVGTGGGQLLVLTKDGQRRWAIQLITDDRNDMNSSPALGFDGIVLAGEDGHIFGVPYDYCLQPAGKADSRCIAGGGEALPADGAFLSFTGPFGSPMVTPPAEIDANDALAFSLYVRKGGDTALALIDRLDTVKVTPEALVEAKISGDRHFVTLVPKTELTGDGNGQVTIELSGSYLENFERKGLVFKGGTTAGTFASHFTFKLHPDRAGSLPLPIPAQIGDKAGAWEMHRLAAPLPTVLPSYNQIGFDSLHYVVGLVEGTEDHAIAWVVGGKLAEDSNRTLIDPATKSVFPLEVSYRGGRVTLLNEANFSLEAMSAVISFDTFRLNARIDEHGASVVAPHLHVSTVCGNIPTFGVFLQSIGFCNPTTDSLVAYGSVLLRPFEDGTLSAPSGVGEVHFALNEKTMKAEITGSTLTAADHSISVFLIDATTNRPVSLGYGLGTTVSADASGHLSSVELTVDPAKLPASLRAYLMVDAYPAARESLAVE